MTLNTLEKRLRELRVPFAVIADLCTGNVVRVGETAEVTFRDLENSLFRDPETVFAMARSLEGQRLPRTWGQGQVRCVVCKPNERVAVGVFFVNDRTPVEAYHWAKKMDAIVADCFAQNSPQDE